MKKNVLIQLISEIIQETSREDLDSNLIIDLSALTEKEQYDINQILKQSVDGVPNENIQKAINLLDKWYGLRYRFRQTNF